MHGIPLDGLWAEQNFVGKGTPLGGDPDGYLGAHSIGRVLWDESEGVYVGVLGRGARRILHLGNGRLLLERDRDPNGESDFMQEELKLGGKVACTLLEWRDGGLCDFRLDAEPGSRFTRHMQAVGLRVEDEIVHGEREAILRGLRSLPLDETAVSTRMGRPDDGEMAQVWNLFELERRAEMQERHLRDIEENLSRMQDLSHLNMASYILGHASDGRVAELEPLAFGAQFGDVEVEFEPLENLPESIEEPPLRFGLGGYALEPLTADAMPSGLRYRVVAEAAEDGATPALGATVRVRIAAWNAWRGVLDKDREREFELGDADVLPGVREALASMKVGEHRVLFVPPHLGDRRPERAGLAQCVSVQLIAVLGSESAPSIHSHSR